ncbi:hypothetical protein [Weissella bombi]|uniref:Polyketide cyclase / dehydrase and lipid transport n=1 Tax=Weissella bombi TaxID=1505725 RepID=A0A1C3YTC1_9LACO|nr:hypothetical protein [Weissella bombi]SCB73309.1 hypothetical protein GA0061074_101117 [Weissella bombi]
MEVKLFTNEILVSATNERIKNILDNVQNILKWDSEIGDISPIDNHKFMILRKGAALNKQEVISVITSEDSVTYVSKKGKIEYRVEWVLDKIENHLTKLKQNVFLNEKNAFLPMAEIIRPLTQNAFKENLYVLKAVCEQEEQFNGASNFTNG